MSFIPEEAHSGRLGNHLAPMIDFLFLMLVFFATLAVSRVSTRDTQVELVQIQEERGAAWKPGEIQEKTITINVLKDGGYQWVTEMRDHEMDSEAMIVQELHSQYTKGLLPQDKEKTRILLKIDKEAQWEPIMKVFFAVRKEGFAIHPVYEPEQGAGA